LWISCLIPFRSGGVDPHRKFLKNAFHQSGIVLPRTISESMDSCREKQRFRTAYSKQLHNSQRIVRVTRCCSLGNICSVPRDRAFLFKGQRYARNRSQIAICVIAAPYNQNINSDDDRSLSFEKHIRFQTRAF
jgi:hypothetical protein